jgi:hypothetical protein
MTISLDELRNGLSPDKDLVFPERPADPEMRESTSIWLFEESGAFGMPRMGIEAEASSWDNRGVQANFAFAGGRLLDGSAMGAPPPAIGPDGRPTVLGAGPLTFRCLEPFRRWTVTFDGPARDRQDPSRSSHVRLEADMVMATPAWIQDVGEDDPSAEGAYMGLGHRFEHLFRAAGVLEVDGQPRPFTGVGLRIHRQSIRRLEGFYGHVWQSALFPDGRAFGYIAYPPKPDGSQYNIGYLYQDGRMIPAKVAKAPWLRRVTPSGEDVSFELESELGRTRIQGSTAFVVTHGKMAAMPGLTLQQGGVRYTWDGKSAMGMIERSSFDEQTTVG